MSKPNTYIIAEAGVNHDGSLQRALDLVDVAAEAKADAVKFQTFKAEKLVTSTAPKAKYQVKQTGSSESQFMMLKKLELNKESHLKIREQCNLKGIQFLSTPFDIYSLHFLVQTLGIPKIKIPSGEITNGPLLLEAAKTGKPLIISTGMCNMEEVQVALGVIAFGGTRSDQKPDLKKFNIAFESIEGKNYLKKNVTLLHCTSAYPTPFNEVNLKVMDTMASTFNLRVGYSDHTLGTSVSIAAVARGAEVIEKHFTLDKSLQGPDHQASLDPDELKTMIATIRQIEVALGQPQKYPTPSEIKNRDIVRKSLVSNQDIQSGEIFSEKNIDVKRPGTGTSPLKYWDWIGQKAEKDFKAEELL